MIHGDKSNTNEMSKEQFPSFMQGKGLYNILDVVMYLLPLENPRR